MEYNIYIITCDKSKDVLKVTIPLLNKYWNISKSVKILGFTTPDMNLPNDYEFISMRPKQLSIDDWSRDIYSIIQNDPGEYVIFMLDDFLPIDYVNSDILDYYLNQMETDKSIVRCALGIDITFLPYDIINNFGTHSVMELKQSSPYRITTQPSIWRKDYLLKFLEKSTNPWNFETENNPQDGNKVMGTVGRYAFRYVEETALSGRHPNNFNILGMRLTDVKWLLDLGVLDENKLQFGQYVGHIPKFSEHGYEFKLEFLKNYITEKQYDEYVIKYDNFYKN